MDKEYKAQLKNPMLRQALLKAKNVPILEHILDRESQKLRKLQGLKEQGKLDFGNMLKLDELRESLYPQVCSEVNDFLGYEGGKLPRLTYPSWFRPSLRVTPVLATYVLSTYQIANAFFKLNGNTIPEPSLFRDVMLGVIEFGVAAYLHTMHFGFSWYNSYFREITLEKAPHVNLIDVIAHEYSHHVQHKKGLKDFPIFPRYAVVSEGHARGVEREFANRYNEKEDNEAFLYSSLDTDVGELKSAYMWMCKKLGLKPAKSLLRIKTDFDKIESEDRLIIQKPANHAFGNALFSIIEETKGKGIYKDMLHANLQLA